MINHVTVKVKDFEKEEAFYEAALTPLGYGKGPAFPRRHRRAQVIRAASSRNHQAVMETPFAVRQRGFPHMEHDSGMF